MFLQANPGRGKSNEEKAELGQKYRIGEEVMPKVEIKRESSADAADRRMIEEVRDMSLREAGVRGSGTNERGVRHRHRESSRDVREAETRPRTREQERRRRRGNQSSTGDGVDRAAGSADSRSQARHIEHQSSLRSLISNSDVDSAEMEAEILRQITEEGLLDGIDLENLDVAQEDELSERIADAYRRRHGHNLRSRDSRTDDSREPTTVQPEQERPRHREQQRSPPTQSTTHSSHPPISRPHLFEAYPTGNGHRRRTSSEHRRQTSPSVNTSAAYLSTDNHRQAARSVTDLSERSRTTTDVRARPTDNVRRTTDPLQGNVVDGHRRLISHSRQSSASSAANTPAEVSSPREIAQPNPRTQSHNEPPPAVETQRDPISDRHIDHERRAPYPLQDLNTTARDPTSALPASPRSYAEPLITCGRCGTSNIAYDLHHYCPQCEDGQYTLCHRCYLQGKGCLYWFGFGKAASYYYQRQGTQGTYPSSHPLPHILLGHRYLQPLPESRLVSNSQLTSSDPRKRLQEGFFCSNCSAFANQCYWKCDVCNDGEWGFCNPCVNQEKCCTHPLLPVAHTSVVSKLDRPLNVTSHSSFTPVPRIAELQSESNRIPLNCRISCEICTCPIPPSATRFHCPQCNNGDYDICTPCYLRLISSNRITQENGDKGWRKCPQGHRMTVIGFEDGPLGQQRVLVKGLVGGHAWKDDQPVAELVDTETGTWRWRDEGTLKTIPADTPSHSPSLTASELAYPPSGGAGLAAVALWAYWPEEGADDELGFPRHAEIREAVNINGDWFWGVYCGRGGLWPGGYARVIR